MTIDGGTIAGGTIDGVTTSALDARMRRARASVLLSLAISVSVTVGLPGVGVLLDPRPVAKLAGTLGILAVAGAQATALYAAATPRPGRFRTRATAGFVLAVALSVPLVATSGTEQGWETWAWLGAAAVGSAPLLAHRSAAVGFAVAVTAISATIGAVTGGSALVHAGITAGAGAFIVGVHWLPLALWGLALEARDGRAAVAGLAVAEERLRFARDVHDLLGHHLSVIALKAELAERLAARDPATAAREAGEARQLAASALTELRATVHGYRRVDLDAQLDAIARVLRSSGVRCTVTVAHDELPVAAASILLATAREATTNVLRHSRAGWCTIELVQSPGRIRLVVANDGAHAARPDAHSSGLGGLTDRLAEAGGTLRTHTAGGVFTLDAVVPLP